MKCGCRGQKGSCWAWLVPADPSHVQPCALWLWKLGCYMPCSLAYMFLPCSETQEASLSGCWPSAGPFSSWCSASLAMLPSDRHRAPTFLAGPWCVLAVANTRGPLEAFASCPSPASGLSNGCFPWPGSPLCSRRFVEAFPRACQSSCQGWVWASRVSGFGLTHLSLAAFGVQLHLRASSQLVLGHVFPAIKEVVCAPDRRQCVCLYVCPCKDCFCLLCAKKRLFS